MRARGTPIRPIVALAAAAAVFLVVLTACGGGSDLNNPGVASPDMVGARVRLMLIKEPPTGNRSVLSTRIGSVLAPYLARPENADEPGGWAQTRERLRRAGLRPVIVPRADLPAIEEALGMQPAGSEVSLNQSPRWTPIASGSTLGESTVIRVHDGLMDVAGGRLRMLLRCYVAPWAERSDGTVPSALRVDLVPQHEAMSRPASDFAAALEAPKVRTIEDAGQILTSLAYEALIGPDDVLLLAPEAPDRTWTISAPGADRDEPAPEPYGDLGPDAGSTLAPARVEFLAGPPPPRPKTVGELILTDATDISDPSKRMIVVVDPVLPGEFRLLPQSRPNPVARGR